MSPAEKLEIQKSLGIRDLTGKTLREVFLKSGLPVAGLATVQAGGFGAYLALTTIMHAVFTSLLGITLPFAAYTGATSALAFLSGPVGIVLSLGVAGLGYFWGQHRIQRSQYAMVVFACVSQSRWTLVPATSRLPSFQTNLLLGNGEAPSQTFSGVRLATFTTLCIERQSSIDSSKVYTEVQKQLDELKQKYERARAQVDRQQQLLDKTNADLLTDKSLQASMTSMLNSAEISLASALKSSAALGNEIERLTTLAAKLKRDATEAQTRHLNQLEKSKTAIRELWQIHFPRMQFDSQPLRWAAEQDLPAFLEMERALAVLANADDPVEVSTGKMYGSGHDHMRFTIPVNLACRVFYTTKGRSVVVKWMGLKKDAPKH